MSLGRACQFRCSDGAGIFFRPGRPGQPTILYYGRDNADAGDRLGSAILNGLRDMGWGILEIDPANRVNGLALDPNRQCDLSRHWRSKLYLMLRLVRMPRLWGYYLHRALIGRSRHTCRSAIRGIAAFGITPNAILGFSAGARFGAAIADALKADCLMCLGYPFKNPHRGDEPDRYAHLASLRTPCLILQGRRDAYGGADDVHAYPLSEAIEVRFLDSDHDLRLEDAALQAAVAIALDFVRAHGPDRRNQP